MCLHPVFVVLFVTYAVTRKTVALAHCVDCEAEQEIHHFLAEIPGL